MKKLTNTELRSLTVGALGIDEDERGLLRFYKYTKTQMDGFGVWNEKSPVLCTTGVRFDFHTNSSMLAFAAATAGKYELYIDGLLRGQYIIGPAEKGGKADVGERIEVCLCDPLGAAGGDYRVTLYLPSHNIGQIEYIEIDVGAYARRHEFACSKKLLMIGDSITQGWKSVYDSLSYANRVSRFFDAESVIQGRGGSYYKEETIEKLCGFEPDVITVAYGTNDFHHYKTLAEIREHVRAYHGRLADVYGDRRILVISPIWRETTEKPMGSFEECRAVVAQEANAHGFIHIDGLKLVPPISELYTDGLHLNDLGFSIYSENLIREMKKYM